MKTGEEAEIVKVELPSEVQERLRYLNVSAGAHIALLKTSPFRRTYIVQARSAKLAIGREVAEGIKICRK